MINNVVLVGRLTKKPELRHTTSNIAVCQFTIAVNRNFNNASGDNDADFISCVAWRSNAENMARFLDRGSLIGIEGRIQTRNFEQDGQRRYVTEVVADSVRFLEPRSSNNNMQNDNYTSSNNQQYQRSNFDGYGNNNYGNNNGYSQNNSNAFGNFSGGNDNSYNYNNQGNFNPFRGQDPFSNDTYETPIKENETYKNPFVTSMDIDVDDGDLPF